MSFLTSLTLFVDANREEKPKPKPKPKVDHQAKFLAKLKAARGNQFTADNIVYKGVTTPATFTCPVHGDFDTNPAYILTQHANCPDCVIEHMRLRFIHKARERYGNYYSYHRTKYRYSNELVTITCPVHGDFERTPAGHLAGGECAICGDYESGGYKAHKEGLLYYLRVTDSAGVIRYKIGITNLTVQDRFSNPDLEMINILGEYRHGNGTVPPKKERFVLCHFAHARYTGPDILSSGNTEIFNHDVLGLEGGGELIRAVNRLQRAH